MINWHNWIKVSQIGTTNEKHFNFQTDRNSSERDVPSVIYVNRFFLLIYSEVDRTEKKVTMKLYFVYIGSFTYELLCCLGYFFYCCGGGQNIEFSTRNKNKRM